MVHNGHASICIMITQLSFLFVYMTGGIDYLERFSYFYFVEKTNIEKNCKKIVLL